MTPPRKPAARKPVARKPTARKPVARKPVAGKPTARKPAPRKPAARKPTQRPAGRPAVRRTPLGRPGLRLHGGFALVVVVLVVLASRLVWLQGVQSTAYAADATSQRLRTTTLVAPRGEITDRSGEPLAQSIEARAVYGEPRIIAAAECPPHADRPCTPETIGAALAPVLNLPAAELTAKLSRKTCGPTKTETCAFVYLARGLDPAVGVKVRALGLVGVGVMYESQRTHPAGDLAVSVTGFTDRDGHGLAGVESGMQDVLAGKDGKTTAEVDKAGRIIPTGTTTSVPPVPGRAVQLTIDRDLQWYTQQMLAAKVAEVHAENGSAVVMDVRTGEILALATAPTFNPDNKKVKPPRDALRNVAVGDVYEPGSVNKVITAAAALEAGIVTPETPVTVPPTYRVGHHTVHDAEQHGVEHLTFAGVLAKSSNIGTVMVAQKVGSQGLYDAMKRFGYGEKTGLGLPGESRGRLPKPEDWSGTSIATIPIGQGVSVNVMQVASVYATVANGGVRVTPTVVKAVADASGHLVPAAKPTSRRVISPEVAATLRTMLEAVVSAEGTAPLAAVPGYRIAGKTGTAQRVVGGKYAPGNYTSSFIGFAPADAPRLVTAVVLQGTGHGYPYYGGSTAGPVFKQIMSFALGGLKIPPTGTTPPVVKLTAG